MTTIQLPAGYDDGRDRGALMAHLPPRLAGWQVESIDGDSATMVEGAPSPRPQSSTVTLAAGTSPAAAPQIAAYLAGQGYDLLEWRPYEGIAVSGRLPGAVALLRSGLARSLKCQPWDLEITAEWEGGRIERVVLLRAPSPSPDPDRRMAVWRGLLSVIPGASAGWRVEEEPGGEVALTFGKLPTLPARVARASLLPARLSDDWARLPIGMGDAGPVVIDLNLGPHSLIVGPTGSGKTILLTQLILAALSNGHRIALIDPVKAGLDFVKIRPWIFTWADTLPAGQAAIEGLYAEVGRRRAVLQREEIAKWADLPAAVREAEGIVPVLAVIDEFGSLVLQDESAKTLPKGHPMREAAETENISRAVILSLTARLAREARYAGIHLAIAIQRPDVGIISGELRSNLTSAIQLGAPGKPLSLDALRMVFPGEAAGESYSILRALDDGRSRGLGVTAAEGGTMSAFRVAFAEASENPTILEAIGVPKAVASPKPAVPPTADLPQADFWGTP